eukprot:1160915-Pelagomonas_calceolata.AAC.14
MKHFGWPEASRPCCPYLSRCAVLFQLQFRNPCIILVALSRLLVGPGPNLMEQLPAGVIIPAHAGLMAFLSLRMLRAGPSS